MIREYELPEDCECEPCPTCDRMTEDAAGGPCRHCWERMYREEDERQSLADAMHDLPPGEMHDDYEGQ